MIHHFIREIHTLAVREIPTCDNFTDSIRCFQLRYLQNNKTIVYKNAVSHFQILDQVLVIDSNTLLVSNDIFRCQRKSRAFFQMDLSVFKCFNTVFRSLGIQHDCNWKREFLSYFFDQINLFLVFFVASM